jgi:hypothetical protein
MEHEKLIYTFETYHGFQYFLGFQVHPPGFSSYRGSKNLLAESTHVRILGHAGWILRSYLHDLCDHDIQAFYRDDRGLRIKILSWALFGYFNARNHQVVFFNYLQIPPDGSELSNLLSGVCHRWWSQVFTPIKYPTFPSSSGARTELPMGVAPEAIVEFFRV